MFKYILPVLSVLALFASGCSSGLSNKKVLGEVSENGRYTPVKEQCPGAKGHQTAFNPSNIMVYSDGNDLIVNGHMNPLPPYTVNRENFTVSLEMQENLAVSKEITVESNTGSAAKRMFVFFTVRFEGKAAELERLLKVNIVPTICRT